MTMHASMRACEFVLLRAREWTCTARFKLELSKLEKKLSDLDVIRACKLEVA